MREVLLQAVLPRLLPGCRAATSWTFTPRDVLAPTNSGRLSLSGAAGTDWDSTAFPASSQFSSLPALSFSQR